MKIIQIRSGTARLVIRRMGWNLNTQKRHIKHRDAPDTDCSGWYDYAHWFIRNIASRYRRSEREVVHEILDSLAHRVENEPNRWWSLALYGDSGYMTSNGFVLDGQVRTYHDPVTVLGPYCKEQGVLPEFEKDDDGLYVFPFNLPDGVFTDIEYDESKPDFGDDDAKVQQLEVESIPAGTEIVVLDEWGLEAMTTEVV
jgi:hypothetical protein